MATELIYVSWGGTGRAATLREALAKAYDSERGLVYLAILDDATFSDIDEPLLDLAKVELAWLLEAQLELTKSQIGGQDVAVRVVVRAGDVVDEVADVVDVVGETEVMIGAPVPIAGHESIADLINALGERFEAPVTLIEA